MPETTADPVPQLLPLSEEQFEAIIEAFEELRANGFYTAILGSHENLALEIREPMLDPEQLHYILGLCDRAQLRPYLFRTETGAPLVLQPQRRSADEKPELSVLAHDTVTSGPEPESPGFTVTEIGSGDGDDLSMRLTMTESGLTHDFSADDPRLAEIVWEAAEKVGERAALKLDGLTVSEARENFLAEVAIGEQAIGRATAALEADG